MKNSVIQFLLFTSSYLDFRQPAGPIMMSSTTQKKKKRKVDSGLPKPVSMFSIALHLTRANESLNELHRKYTLRTIIDDLVVPESKSKQKHKKLNSNITTTTTTTLFNHINHVELLPEMREINSAYIVGMHGFFHICQKDHLPLRTFRDVFSDNTLNIIVFYRDIGHSAFNMCISTIKQFASIVIPDFAVAATAGMGYDMLLQSNLLNSTTAVTPTVDLDAGVSNNIMPFCIRLHLFVTHISMSC